MGFGVWGTRISQKSRHSKRKKTRAFFAVEALFLCWPSAFFLVFVLWRLGAFFFCCSDLPAFFCCGGRARFFCCSDLSRFFFSVEAGCFFFFAAEARVHSLTCWSAPGAGRVNKKAATAKKTRARFCFAVKAFFCWLFVLGRLSKKAATTKKKHGFGPRMGHPFT